MGKLDSYNIQLKTLSVGTSTVEYHLDHEYFALLGDVEIQKGDITARVKINKTAKQFDLQFELEGSVVVLCDRCLEEMNQPIKASGHLIVTLGKEFKDDGDDRVVIPEEQGILNVSWFLYEFIELAIPIKHVHPFGQCNKGMSQKLSAHIVEMNEDGSLPMLNDDEAENEEEETPIDPRWAALKNLKD